MNFSIIVPTYNEESDIDILLTSLNEQSYPAYEIIFVDGKSSDETIKKLELFKGQNNNIKIYSDKRFDRNRARNFGIKISGGDIIILLNADVRLSRNFLYHLKQYYEYNKKSYSVMINSRPIIYENNRISNYFLYNHIKIILMIYIKKLTGLKALVAKKLMLISPLLNQLI